MFVVIFLSQQKRKRKLLVFLGDANVIVLECCHSIQSIVINRNVTLVLYCCICIFNITVSSVKLFLLKCIYSTFDAIERHILYFEYRCRSIHANEANKDVSV